MPRDPIFVQITFISVAVVFPEGHSHPSGTCLHWLCDYYYLDFVQVFTLPSAFSHFFFFISLLSSKFHQSVNVLFKFSLHKVFFKNTFFFINAYSNESFAVWKWKSCLTSELQFLCRLMGINYSINIYFTVWLWWLAQCLTHCKHAVNVNF